MDEFGRVLGTVAVSAAGMAQAIALPPAAFPPYTRALWAVFSHRLSLAPACLAAAGIDLNQAGADEQA